MPDCEAGVKRLVWFAEKLFFGPLFCEKNVNKSQDNWDWNYKCQKFNGLHGDFANAKYQEIAPTLGVDNSCFCIKVAFVDGRKGWLQNKLPVPK